MLIASIASLAAIAPSTSSAKAHRHIPGCAQISRTAMATLAETGPLTLRERFGNLCIFSGKVPGHYKPTLEIRIDPYVQPAWNATTADAATSAAAQEETFGRVNPKLVFVSGTFTSMGLSRCTPGTGTPGNGQSQWGPACAGEPNADHFSAYGNGSKNPRHLHLMVSGGLTGQQGDVHLSHLLELVKEIISGKIH